MSLINSPSHSIPLIGRKKELTEITAKLSASDCRILTLTGSGGIGKTRLALEILNQQQGNYLNGVYFVSLQSIDTEEAIIHAIADALEFTFYDSDNIETSLINFLEAKTLLLIIDNFEHLLSGAGLLSRILDHAPYIKILVTSRERLNLREEWVFPVSGLSFPADNYEEEKDNGASIELFKHCTYRTGYTIRTDDNPAIARICRLVEGIPLAIELAATRVHVLSCEQIAMEIEQNLDVLATKLRNIPERHRSIRAVFDTTWQQLTPSQQQIFAGLSVFRGGWTFAALEAITGTSLSDLQALIDKSLIRLEKNRYAIHELLRQYAAEKLENSATADDMRDAHCLYYLNFLQEHEADIKGSRQIEILNDIEADEENIFTAWRRAIKNGNGEAIHGATATLFLFAESRSREIEVEGLFKTGTGRISCRHFP